jgi:quercetin dioxygenase-like cupin family protein
MNKRFFGHLFTALFICFAFITCKEKSSTETKETTADTAGTAQTAQPEPNPADMDAVKVAPSLYKVLADTLGIRMVEVNYKQGDSSAMHWHPDYAGYAVQGGTVTFYGKDGSKTLSELPSGMSLTAPAGFHSVKNTGKTDIKVILFEVNRTGQATTPDAATDATKVAPEVYKLKSDTLGIRVIEVVAKPDQKIAMHAHPDNALYVTDPGTAEFTDKEGKKTVVSLTKGMSLIGPAEMHSVNNAGKTIVKAILVEVNRAMK